MAEGPDLQAGSRGKCWTEDRKQKSDPPFSLGERGHRIFAVVECITKSQITLDLQDGPHHLVPTACWETESCQEGGKDKSEIATYLEVS